MSTLNAQPTFISVDDYLVGEEGSELRHEYLDGQVYAMGGASDRHGLIVNAVAFALTPAARRKGCQLFTSDMKVRLEIGGKTMFYYPDLLLSCEPLDREKYFRSQPCLLIEVLSASTQRIDRREKLLSYQTIGSLQGYLLIEQDAQRLEMYRRSNNWQVEYYAEGALWLECVETTLALADVYMDLSRT